mmetsp:Transcript_9554/g.20055  ORF Transcript_9554/g.20055 Transcript_9554/m.20055 type:complete len:210 (-) Transcript_9554:328-957(-)
MYCILHVLDRLLGSLLIQFLLFLLHRLLGQDALHVPFVGLSDVRFALAVFRQCLARVHPRDFLLRGRAIVHDHLREHVDAGTEYPLRWLLRDVLGDRFLVFFLRSLLLGFSLLVVSTEERQSIGGDDFLVPDEGSRGGSACRVQVLKAFFEVVALLLAATDRQKNALLGPIGGIKDPETFFRGHENLVQFLVPGETQYGTPGVFAVWYR